MEESEYRSREPEVRSRKLELRLVALVTGVSSTSHNRSTVIHKASLIPSRLLIEALSDVCWRGN
jgi:hypothetical protein